MTLVINGTEVDITENGFLVDRDQWSEDVASALAQSEGIELTERHWDVINYLRDEFFNNRENQPNNRTMVKDLGAKWGEKINSKTLFDLFPGNPSKQAGLIAGLPESRRKGGY